MPDEIPVRVRQQCTRDSRVMMCIFDDDVGTVRNRLPDDSVAQRMVPDDGRSYCHARGTYWLGDILEMLLVARNKLLARGGERRGRKQQVVSEVFAVVANEQLELRARALCEPDRAAYRRLVLDRGVYHGEDFVDFVHIHT